MEKVADWQLEHPCTFELHWRTEDRAGEHYARIGWDGTVYRSITLPPAPKPTAAATAAWSDLARMAGSGVGFFELPAAVQSAWRKATGLTPDALVEVQVMDEGATRSWEMGTFYHGLLALRRLTDRPRYHAALREMVDLNGASLGRRIYHADDHCVGYLYLSWAMEENDPRLLAGVQSRFDWILKHPSPAPMDLRQGQERWTWSDALFMAPPVWVKLGAITGDRRYVEFMDREWWETVAALFSAEEGLFYRDVTYFGQRERNGRPVFWSRGNGWVLASLALMIEELPQDLPSRAKYEDLFRRMAHRVAELQPADGLWRSSLLDPDSNPQPETSSTAMFCYAFARGVRLGLLAADVYAPRALKAWQALQHSVRVDGHLGGIQQPGAGPGSAGPDSTAPYGVGAFLMAGSEIYELSLVREEISAAR